MNSHIYLDFCKIQVRIFTQTFILNKFSLQNQCIAKKSHECDNAIEKIHQLVELTYTGYTTSRYTYQICVFNHFFLSRIYITSEFGKWIKQKWFSNFELIQSFAEISFSLVTMTRKKKKQQSIVFVGVTYTCMSKYIQLQKVHAENSPIFRLISLLIAKNSHFLDEIYYDDNLHIFKTENVRFSDNLLYRIKVLQ